MRVAVRSGLIVLMLFAPPMLAARVAIPLELDHTFLESLAREQVFTGPGGAVRLNDDGTGCQYLELRDPVIGSEGTHLTLRTTASARAGRQVAGQCLLLLDWYGQLELEQQPTIGDDGRSIVLRTVSWRALRPDGTTDTVSTTIGGWVEQWLPVDLRQTRIDLAQPLGDLKDFLALSVGVDSDVANVNAALDSLGVDDVAVGEDRVTVTLGLEAPPPSSTPQPRESPLSEAEVARLQRRLDSLDAFITYTVKNLARSPGSVDATALLAALLELRIEVVAVLVEPQRGDEDAARTLFIRAWERLTPILRTVAEQQTDHQSAVRYLTFIGAGDMLRALDSLGPSTGVDISTDGLRRLARILIPDDPGDPLLYDDAVDAELRSSLGFGAPLPLPQGREEASWLNWLITPVFASEGLAPATVQKLNSWVPKPREMDVYLPMVRDVLQYVVTQQLRSRELAASFHRVFRALVLTAAWQESCWRQFVARNDKRVPMQSASGDLGMMQVNPKIWRGFYDLQGLRWDIVYNARAGADILENHLIKYAIAKKEHQTTGSVDNLARSAYAAYNGGPRQYDRYRRKEASAQGKKADSLFYEKYRVVSSGKELGVTACFAG